MVKFMLVEGQCLKAELKVALSSTSRLYGRDETGNGAIILDAIADACQSKDAIRADLSAKGLARIWNVDYKTLLRSSCL